MIFRLTLALLISLIVLSCSKDKKVVYQQSEKLDPFAIYKEGLEAFENNDFFMQVKNFLKQSLNFENVDFAAKSAIMSSFSLYGINFYTDALENLERYLKKYPSDKFVIYAHYLIAIIYFEQISDEKDLEPLLKQIIKLIFLKTYPNSEYAIDLKFKKDLIQNQLAAKELFVQDFIFQQKNGFLQLIKKIDYMIMIKQFL